jgi:hypothetical protein
MWVPLYEAKLIYQFDHRFATYDGATQANLNAGILPQTSDVDKSNPGFGVSPRYWVPASMVTEWQRPRHERWLLSFRAITSAITERTGIFTLLPLTGAGHSVLFIHADANPQLTACLLANTNCLPFDYILRQKIGGSNLSFHVLRQLPLAPPPFYAPDDLQFIAPRVLELTCTAWDVQPFLDDVWSEADDRLRQCILRQWQENHDLSPREGPEPLTSYVSAERGFGKAPFVWNESRRRHLRADLDAYYAHLYGLTRDELRYILDPKDIFGTDFPSETFRVLKEREEKEFGEYRTRRLVLEAFDKLAESPRFRDAMSSRHSALDVPKISSVSVGVGMSDGATDVY